MADIAGIYRAVLMDTCYVGCTGRYTAEIIVSALEKPDLEVVSTNSSIGEACIMVNVKEFHDTITVKIDWNGDGTYEDSRIMNENNFIICEDWLPIGQNLYIRFELIDSQGCRVFTGIQVHIQNLCCSDYDYPYRKNFPACLETVAGIPRLERGQIGFKHYLKYNANLEDTISSSLRSFIKEAYQKAEEDTDLLPINDIASDYPEVHYISAMDAYGGIVKEFSGTTPLLIYYGDGYSRNVPEDHLHIFWLNQDSAEWQMVDSSEVDKENKVVTARIDKLNEVYTIMGFQHDDEFCSEFSIFPVPFNFNADKLTFSYKLTEPSNVDISVYSIFGGNIWKQSYVAGEPGGQGNLIGLENQVSWNGTNSLGRKISNGAYIAVLDATGTVTARRCTKKLVFGVSK
jgi:hypothetical protein